MFNVSILENKYMLLNAKLLMHQIICISEGYIPKNLYIYYFLMCNNGKNRIVVMDYIIFYILLPDILFRNKISMNAIDSSFGSIFAV